MFSSRYRTITNDRFYLIPTDAGSREALEIDRLNFDISLIGKISSKPKTKAVNLI